MNLNDDSLVVLKMFPVWLHRRKEEDYANKSKFLLVKICNLMIPRIYWGCQSLDPFYHLPCESGSFKVERLHLVCCQIEPDVHRHKETDIAEQ